MTKLLKVTAIVLPLVLGVSLAAAQESGYDLYQKALVKERAVGDVEEAIHLYQRVTREFGGNHALAAKAQYRLGLLYNRLGRNTEALRAFNAVVSQYSDQTDLVREARAKLVSTSARPSNSTSEKSKLPTTMGVRRIWEGDTEGSPSPDGALLSFTDWETGDLAVRDVETGKSRRLTGNASVSTGGEFAEYSVISPDGKQIVYTWWNKETYDLRLIGVDGSNSRLLYGDNKVSYIHPFEWSKDGKQVLVCVSYQDLTEQIGLISVASGKLRVIKTLEARGAPARMSLSPDNQYIVFDARQKRDAPEHDLYLLAVNDGGETPLITHPAHEEVIGWTPDGKRILFSSDRTGVNSLWSVRMGAGKALQAPELVKSDLGRVIAMGFARDGSLYLGVSTTMRDIYIATLDPATREASFSPKALTSRYVGIRAGAAWSPDGKSLAYTSTRGVSQHGLTKVLTIRTIQSDVEREISPALVTFWRPQWSPDSRSLVVVGMDTKGVWGIYRIDEQTGQTSSASVVQTFLGQPILSADGKSIYHVSPRSRETRNDRVLVRDLETGQEKEIFTPDGPDTAIYGLTLSSDGRQLAFFLTSPGSATTGVLKIINSAGQPVREIGLNNKQFPSNTATIAWTPDGRYLVFGATAEGHKIELWRVPVSGGPFQKVGISADTLRDLRVSPGGERVAFTAGEFKSEVWVLEHFLTSESNAVAKRRLSHRRP